MIYASAYLWSQGRLRRTGSSQLPSRVISTVDYPFGSPSLVPRVVSVLRIDYDPTRTARR
jgi:hypothetical protein